MGRLGLGYSRGLGLVGKRRRQGFGLGVSGAGLLQPILGLQPHLCMLGLLRLPIGMLAARALSSAPFALLAVALALLRGAFAAT